MLIILASAVSKIYRAVPPAKWHFDPLKAVLGSRLMLV